MSEPWPAALDTVPNVPQGNVTDWALALPERFPNGRGIVIDVLREQVHLGGVLLGVDHFGPAGFPGQPSPFVEVYRDPHSGGLNPRGWEDTQVLQLGMWIGSEREAYELVEEVRRVLGAFNQGGLHKGVWLDELFEAAGPGAPSEDDEDRHELLWPWTVVTRQHWGAAVYP